MQTLMYTETKELHDNYDAMHVNVTYPLYSRVDSVNICVLLDFLHY